jgi:hypothetical protein
MAMRKIWYIFSVLILVNLFMRVGISQDTHYWNLQYGARSTLLGGAVIGSVQDFAATYHNPGAISLFPNPEFLLSAQVYEWTTLTLQDGGGIGEDLAYTSIQPAPSLLAGSFTLNWLKKHKFAYSILTRQSMKFGFQGRRGESREIISGAPGDEVFGGEIIGDQDLSELWIGLTWSNQVHSKIGVGITQYFAVRNQKTRFQVIAHAWNEINNLLASSVLLDQIDYQNYRLLWKGGIAVDLRPLTLGLTVTTPSVNLFGSGSSLYDLAVNGLDVNNDGVEDPIFAANYQKDISSTYKTSWAIGGGFGYKFKNYRLHFSSEWFSKINSFDVIKTQDFTAQSYDTTLSTTVSHELKSVLNWGVGLEAFLSERFSGFGSFVTDYSAYVPQTETNLALSTWDIYHIAFGTVFSVGRAELTLGATYAFGSDNVERLADFSGASEDNQLRGEGDKTKLTYSRLKFIFGFSIQL